MFFFGYLLWPFWGGFEESYAHLEEVLRLITTRTLLMAR